MSRPLVRLPIEPNRIKVRAEVRRTVDTEAEVDEELHELLYVLTRG